MKLKLKDYSGNILTDDLLEIKDWLLYCIRKGWTSYSDYQTLIWEEYCQQEQDPAYIKGIDY